MSQRTIVEINHDIAHIKYAVDALELAECLNRAVASGSYESWDLLERWGFRRITQLHHSTRRKLVTEFGEYQIG